MCKLDINNLLFHYTSLDSMLKIIESGMLKFGALPRMNDITESTKELYYESVEDTNGWAVLNLLETRINSIGQISLSQSGLYPGYALHSLWGNYAECGEGCCIALDKSMIVRESESNGYYNQTVIYDNPSELITLPIGCTVDNYLATHYEKLFFHKRLEWEHEQEYRIINLNCNPGVFNGLRVAGAIVAIIFHTNCDRRVFDCPKVRNVLGKLGEIPSLEYHYSSMWGNKNNNMLIDSNGKDWLNDVQLKDIDI